MIDGISDLEEELLAIPSVRPAGHAFGPLRWIGEAHRELRLSSPRSCVSPCLEEEWLDPRHADPRAAGSRFWNLDRGR